MKKLKIGEPEIPKISEDFLQKMCVKWFKIQYPGILIHHSPNGGSRNIIEAVKFKNMGTQPGCPDTLIFKAMLMMDIAIPGLAIELKIKGGKVSEHQMFFMEKLKKEGWVVRVCWSFEEFKETVINYFAGKLVP